MDEYSDDEDEFQMPDQEVCTILVVLYYHYVCALFLNSVFRELFRNAQQALGLKSRKLVDDE